MTEFQVAQKKRPWPLLLVWHPLFWVAIALHGLVLFAPLNQTEPAAPPKPEDQKGVKLTKLTVAPKRKQAAPSSTVPRQPTVRRKTQPPAPVVVKSTPTPQPSTTATGTTAAKPSRNQAIAQPQPSPTKAADQGLEVDQDTEQIVAGIDVAMEQLIPDPKERESAKDLTSSIAFPEETLPYFFANPEAEEARSGVKAIRYAPNIEILDVQTRLSEALTGYTIIEASTYGTQPLFKVQKGTVIRYVSLVKVKTGRGTFIVLWEQNPS